MISAPQIADCVITPAVIKLGKKEAVPVLLDEKGRSDFFFIGYCVLRLKIVYFRCSSLALFFQKMQVVV